MAGNVSRSLTYDLGKDIDNTFAGFSSFLSGPA
jgi:hypothetical protein